MRKKADGTAFEREFRDCMEKKFYVKRLPTLNTGYAGQGQPADFVVIGERFNYVEVKETASDSFSITSMQQYPEMKDFIELKERYKSAGKAAKEMNYWIIVHYIERKIIRAITGEVALEMSKKRKALRYDTAEALEASSLEDLKEKIKL